MTSKLTVDIGLRWEYYTPFVGIADKGGLSNYNPENNTVEVAGYGNISQNVGVKNNFKNFAPRLGVSYRFGEKTVLRAGFGTTIVPFPDNRYAYNFPVKQSEQFNAPNLYSTATSMAEGFGDAHHLPGPGQRRHRRERLATQERAALVRAAGPQGREAPQLEHRPAARAAIGPGRRGRLRRQRGPGHRHRRLGPERGPDAGRREQRPALLPEVRPHRRASSASSPRTRPTTRCRPSSIAASRTA